ncbi:putative lipid II flippase FtsW [Frisingicoccus sp.]|uniref:putative lipid II flippase FtsW n=2 Tax=Frisingicoccus sp. TaxID=1918627 RepID=UPI002E7A4633|nr:putative lipid II flippase FtsW [Frisingicoccus sp.]
MERQMAVVKEKKNKTRLKTEKYFDYSLLFIVIFLVCFGLVMIYSTSAYNSQISNNGDSFYYLKRQGMLASAGLVGMLIISRIPYHFWKRFTLPAYVVMNGMLLVVLLYGAASHGQKRWIEIAGIRFQPSELAKAVLIIFLAHVASRSVKRLKNWRGVVKCFALALPMILLVTVSNLSTGIILLGISFIIIFVASSQYKIFGGVVGAGVAVMLIFLKVAAYRMNRIEAWLNVETSEYGYQTRQALYAIGSGGVFGKGLGRSVQKLSYVPEAHNDMIFSIICEELGLFGAIAIILLFLLLLWRCMIIANNAPDLYGALMVVGVMAQIGLQVIINIGVVTNTLPNTGIPLPFISYGGTSVAIILCEVGLVLSVSRSIRFKR